MPNASTRLWHGTVHLSLHNDQVESVRRWPIKKRAGYSGAARRSPSAKWEQAVEAAEQPPLLRTAQHCTTTTTNSLTEKLDSFYFNGKEPPAPVRPAAAAGNRSIHAGGPFISLLYSTGY